MDNKDTDDQYWADIEKEADASRNKALTRQQEMKNLSDEQVMEVLWKKISRSEAPDTTELLASWWECKSRSRSAWWPWKRLFNKSAAEKWFRFDKLISDEIDRQHRLMNDE